MMKKVDIKFFILINEKNKQTKLNLFIFTLENKMNKKGVL